jgi:superfamily II DNA or RNA helicase
MASVATPKLLDRWLPVEESPIAETITKLWGQRLQVYRVEPTRVEEDYGHEWAAYHGAYKGRQLFELVQNAADAMIEAGIEGRIETILTPEALYCANEGAPIDAEGTTALLHSHMSRKRGDQIGHFGLGFKSVLAVTKEPKFFSRSGCFEFDGAWAADQIRKIVPSAEKTPTLRLARMLQPDLMAQADPELARLMEWATTVVKLPCQEAEIERLVKAAREFPVEFLLFTKNVREILITIRASGHERRIRVVPGSRGTVDLVDGSSMSSWRVFGREYAPVGAEAIQESERPIIPLAWAVPLRDATARGRFWSFFPTNDQSTLKGILNAGWATSMDRHSLVSGALNTELLNAFAHLVADSLELVFDPRDPAAHLDVLPARDDVGWADKILSESLFARLRERPVVPDGGAVLRVGRDLKCLPAGLPESVLFQWSAIEPPVSGWAHAAVERKDRRYRAIRLGVDESQSVVAWLEAVVAEPTTDRAKQAVLLAGALVKEKKHVDQVRQARFILTAAGMFVAPNPAKLFLRVENGEEALATVLVHPELVADPAVQDAMKALGIAELDDLTVLEGILSAAEVDWAKVWETLRRLPSDFVLRKLQDLVNEGKLHVRTVAGTFERSTYVLLPGPVVPGPNNEDAAYCLDVEYHAGEVEALKSIGLVAEPKPGGARLVESWHQEYLSFVRAWFQQECEKQGLQTPRLYLVKADPMPVAGPLEPLRVLSAGGRARLTEQLLPLANKDLRWEVHHETRLRRYPSFHFPPPSAWTLLVKGCLWTSLGPRPVGETVGGELSGWGELLPVWNQPGGNLPTWSLPTSLEAVGPAAWDTAMKRTLASEDIGRVGEFYVKAGEHGVAAPEVIRCCTASGLGERRPAEVYVAPDGLTVDSLLAQGLAALPVPDQEAANTLMRVWGLQDSSGLEHAAVGYVQCGVPTPASDRFPSLVGLAGGRAEALQLVPCSELWLTVPSPTGHRTDTPEFVHEEGRLYFLDRLSLDCVLQIVCDLLRVPFTKEALRVVRNEDLLARVRMIEPLEDKLVALVGAEGLRRCIPATVVEAAAAEGDELATEELAGVALAIHGVSVLQVLKRELAAAGLCPPGQWAGGDTVVDFVRSLGFPDEFAGTSSSQRPPWFEVQGRVDLKPLHEFQEKVKRQLRAFLDEPDPDRGLLSLPTGAGKTRVVVQTLVEAFHDGRLKGTILWLADREELCEQAVQTWAEVWRACGPDQLLRISRFWGSTNRKVQRVELRPHLVVATYQTLRRRLVDDYVWLSTPECIVIDEAHGSTAPSYTEILTWLGLDSRRTICRLIGLTATPFRGGAGDVEETTRLVKRYRSRRFDHGIFACDDPYPYLQGLGVLSFVDHQLLRGTNIQLQPDEMKHLETFREMPSSAEDRLGRVVERNRVIVDAVAELEADCPALVFAVSVDHAELLAALLVRRGIKAAAISSRTDDEARRYAIRAFKEKRLQVLTNYGVLTTGFDAPGVRALFVTRPVYSPGLYQQMIGRGLRGKANGGKERCLIVNVEDNVINYGEKLAFHHFEYLWK